MPFSIYNTLGSSEKTLGTMSPARSSRYFVLEERTDLNPSDVDRAKVFDGLFNISGIANDTPQISYSTTWTNGPAASLRLHRAGLCSDLLPTFLHGHAGFVVRQPRRPRQHRLPGGLPQAGLLLPALGEGR